MKIQRPLPPVPTAPAAPVARAAAVPVRPASSFDPSVAAAPAGLPSSPNVLATRPLGFEAAPSQAPGRLPPSDPATLTAVATARAALGSSLAAGRDFTPKSVERDALGQVHVRMEVLQNGAPVFGKQVIVHLGPDGALLGTTGTERLPAPTPPLRASQSIGAEAAVDAALAAFGHRADLRPRAERVFVPDASGSLTEAFRVELESSEAGTRATLLIAADSGAVLQRLQRHAPEPGPSEPSESKRPAVEGTEVGGAGNDRSLYSGTVELGTQPEADGSHVMKDGSRGKGITVLDTRNSTDPKNVVEIRDDDGAWGQPGDPRAHDAAVDVMFGAQLTYDFYKEVLGRDSIDGAGEAITAHINLGKSNHNAYWNGTVIKFGPGDKDGTSGPLVSVDVLGHELTHGLTERTADLVYAGESGGLNEAWSDIFGTATEWYASQKHPELGFDWKLAEDGWTPGIEGDALRYLDDPTRDGKSVDHYSKIVPRMDVHHTSGIANNAFTLLVKGGANRTSGLQVEAGIGMEPAIQIFYRALTVYMTPDTDFAGAREATLKAAADLFGADSVQAATLAKAWTAVGVG